VVRCRELKEKDHGHDLRIEGMVILHIRKYLQSVILLTRSVCYC
jgi:hypothetical protein